MQEKLRIGFGKKMKVNGPEREKLVQKKKSLAIDKACMHGYVLTYTRL